MKKIIIDVREPEEYARSHVRDAINIPPAELFGDVKQLAQIPKDTEIIVYCRTGNRADMAIKLLKAKGFTNLTNGISEAHVNANRPESRNSSPQQLVSQQCSHVVNGVAVHAPWERSDQEQVFLEIVKGSLNLWSGMQ